MPVKLAVFAYIDREQFNGRTHLQNRRNAPVPDERGNFVKCGRRFGDDTLTINVPSPSSLGGYILPGQLEPFSYHPSSCTRYLAIAADHPARTAHLLWGNT